MKRFLVPTLLMLAICLGGGRARAQESDESGPVVTKPPKLVKFVPAVYPKEKHDAHITGSVLLSIEIGDDGKVGNVEVIKGAAPDFDAAAVAAAKQFVFEPAEIDNQPAPVKITYRYDFTIVEQIVKAGPQINFDGVVLERFKKKPLPRVTVTLVDLGNVKAVTDDDGHFAFIDVPPGTHKIEISNPRLITVTTEETIAVGKRRTVKIFRRGEGGGGRRRGDRARAPHQEGGGRDAHPHRGGAPRPRHAGRHAEGRAEPAGRRAVVVRLGRAHRLGLGAQRDQGQRRRRRDPGALPRGRLALDDQLGPGAVDRSFAGLVRRGVRARPRRAGPDRARVRSPRRGRTATSPPT